MPVDPVSIGLSVLQGGVGLIQSLSGQSKVNSLERQRQSYHTPEEIDKILKLALNQGGGDTIARDYKNSQLDNAFAGITNTAQKLGADPNNFSSLWEQLVQGKLRVGEEFHASNMEAMSKVYNALTLVADNNAAEQKSKDDLLKDRIAAASGQTQAGYQNISGGLNTALSAIQSSKAADLFNQKPKV